MAISVYFRKLREDQTEVEYEWGDTPTSTDRRLIIDLHTMQVRPDDGRNTIQFDACARRISVLYGQTGSWPGPRAARNTDRPLRTGLSADPRTTRRPHRCHSHKRR